MILIRNLYGPKQVFKNPISILFWYNVQIASHLCLGEFAPVWFQVVNNAINSSWQWDAMNKQDHQDQIWEHSCKIHNLHTYTDTLLYRTLIFQPKCKTTVPPEIRYFWIIRDLCLLSQYESFSLTVKHRKKNTARTHIRWES